MREESALKHIDEIRGHDKAKLGRVMRSSPVRVRDLLPRQSTLTKRGSEEVGITLRILLE